MFNTYIELPSGAVSRPHEDATEEAAQKIFDRFVEIMKSWVCFSADVIMTDGKTELKRSASPMFNFELFLRRHVQFKEIGWTAIGEHFTRYALWRTRWFNIYLHQLDAPNWHPECHDHPWGFIAILLRRGYLEQVGKKKYRRRVGSILFRPATFSHNVITPYGTSWSLIFTTPKSRDWGFKPCENHIDPVGALPWVGNRRFLITGVGIIIMHDADCMACQEVQGVCTDCEGCMVEHCECDPCQHGKARADECGFCKRRHILLECAQIFDTSGEA